MFLFYIKGNNKYERIVIFMKSKKLLTMTVAFLIIFSLAACSQNTQGAVDGNLDSPAPDPSEKTLESGDNTATEDNESNENGDIGNSSDNSKETAGDRVFTLKELSAYNGQDGMPAYIAVDGVVYDVSNVGPWKNGTHNSFKAGEDLTVEIKEISPHGVGNLEGLPIVGKLATE